MPTQLNTKSLFDEDYFENGLEKGLSCYSRYRWMPELTIPLAARLAKTLNIADHHHILDFGCAKGFLVRAFHLLHYHAYGVDISEYAINQAHADIRDRLKLIEPGTMPPFMTPGRFRYNWIIAKDVLEHVPYEQIDAVLKGLHEVGHYLCVIVPLGEKGRYVIPDYELDVTHHIREDLNWWTKKIEKAGFVVTHATWKMKHVKENWARWERGNGFIIAGDGRTAL